MLQLHIKDPKVIKITKCSSFLQLEPHKENQKHNWVLDHHGDLTRDAKATISGSNHGDLRKYQVEEEDTSAPMLLTSTTTPLDLYQRTKEQMGAPTTEIAQGHGSGRDMMIWEPPSLKILPSLGCPEQELKGKDKD